jgi:hypothetical protein
MGDAPINPATRRRVSSTRSSGITWMTSCAPPPTGPMGLAPLPWTQTVVVFSYAMVFFLFVNDVLKVALIKRLGLRT